MWYFHFGWGNICSFFHGYKIMENTSKILLYKEEKLLMKHCTIWSAFSFHPPLGLLKAMPSYFWNFRETPCENDLCHVHLLTNLNSKWIAIDTAAFPSSIYYNNCHGKVILNHHEQNISYTVLLTINWTWKRYYQQWRLKKKDFASPFVRARNVICGVTHTAWTEAIVDKNMPSKNFVMEHCTAKELSTRPSWRLFQTNCQQAIY